MTANMGPSRRDGKGRANAKFGPKPLASKLKGGVTFPVFAAVVAAADAVAGGKPGDQALAKAARQFSLSPREGRRAFDLADQIFRHWNRLGWLWRKTGAEAGGRERTLLALTLLLKATPSEIAMLLRDRTATEPLHPAESNALEKCADSSLTSAEFPATVRWECPPHLWTPLRAALGDHLERELEAMLTAPQVTLRVNMLKTTVEAAREALTAQGVAVEPGRWSPWALRTGRDAEISQLPAFKEGWVEFQDEGSQMVAALTTVAPGRQVLDLCAGAGGKTLALAMLMQNKGHLVAADTHTGRLARAKQRLKRAGAVNAECVALTPKWLKAKRGRFDRVLIDAPCSGTGAWARNPDQRWTLAPEALGRLTVEQDALLAQGVRMLAAGGRLIYATCSLLKEENEDRIAQFLATHPDFTISPARQAWEQQALGPWPCDQDQFLRVTPAKHHTDGFFAAILCRKPLA